MNKPVEVTDEELYEQIIDLLERFSQCSQRARSSLAALRTLQAKGLDKLEAEQRLTLQTWDRPRAEGFVSITRDLAEAHVSAGQAMLLQAGVVEQLNEKIMTLKERLSHGKIDHGV